MQMVMRVKGEIIVDCHVSFQQGSKEQVDWHLTVNEKNNDLTRFFISIFYGKNISIYTDRSGVERVISKLLSQTDCSHPGFVQTDNAPGWFVGLKNIFCPRFKPVPKNTLGTFRLDYKHEIEYEYD